jgi:hypothetical protein
MSTSSWHSAENSLHSENDSEFVDVESATSSSSSSSVSSSSESSDRFEAIARVMKLNNYSSLQSMRSVRSRANSVDADVVTTFVESVERVATARRVLESSAAGADVDAPAVPDAKKVKEATKGIENLKKEVEMVRNGKKKKKKKTPVQKLTFESSG